MTKGIISLFMTGCKDLDQKQVTITTYRDVHLSSIYLDIRHDQYTDMAGLMLTNAEADELVATLQRMLPAKGGAS